MLHKAIMVLSAAGALAVLLLAMRGVPRAQEVPTLPAGEPLSMEEREAWEELEFNENIPPEWGPLVSINRAARGGECYTFWFMDQGGTLRGITTRSFTGPLRGSFFPEVHVIRRGPGPKIIPLPAPRLPQPELEKVPELAKEPAEPVPTAAPPKPAAERPPLEGSKPKP